MKRARRHDHGSRRAPGGIVAAMLALATVPGCRDRIADPTQGFIDVLTGDVSGAQVFVDGEPSGSVGKIGPLDAGIYTVSVVRECYHVAPFSQEIEVRPGRTVSAVFTLELGDAGSIHATGLDEILGTAVMGAEILLDTGSGLQPTGVYTPDTLDRVPCGNVQVALRADGYAASDPVTVTVVPFETEEPVLTLGPPRAVLAEMFTYVYCPNCPDASTELEELQEGDPSHVYVVEWHSYDWPNIPLFDSRWEDRRHFYGVDDYPAVIIHGGSDPSHQPVVLIGSNATELDAYHARIDDYLSACENDCPLALKVTGSISAAGADATVRVLYRGGALPTGLVLTILLTENHVQVLGNQPYFSYVGRDISQSPVSFPTAGEVSSFPKSFPVDGSWNPDELHVLAWVQSPDVSHKVLAVGGI